MNYLKILSVVSVAAVVGCAGTTAPESGSAAGAVTTEAAFRSAIVGKTIAFNGNTLVINADNTVSGPWNGSGITGTWYWEDQYWCREVTIGGNARPLDCQTWSVDGAVATVTRDRGNGQSFDYTIS